MKRYHSHCTDCGMGRPRHAERCPQRKPECRDCGRRGIHKPRCKGVAEHSLALAAASARETQGRLNG